ncbi:hypothetical protein HYQ45_013991 [Verticillium longisporum]|uniref:Uncharacterized protein n=1 Tax=Verticillium longisporum TaxID=100787 RepID=A0A8I2ZBH4_VERLO|nr:hypothetical protein HYQ45_013991 [Verticillium longisporum]
MPGRKKNPDIWVINSKKYKPNENVDQKKKKRWKGKKKKAGNHNKTRKRSDNQKSQKTRRKPRPTSGRWKRSHAVAGCDKGTEVDEYIAQTGQHQQNDVRYTRKQKRIFQAATLRKLEKNGQELQPNREQRDRDAEGFEKVARRQRGKVRKQRLAKNWIEEPWDISTDSDFAWLHQTRENDAAESDVLSNKNTAHSEEGSLEEAQDQLQMTQSKGLTADYVPLVDAADGALKALLESVPSLDDRVAELGVEASTVLTDIGALQIRVKEVIAKRDDIVTKLVGLCNTGAELQPHIAEVAQALRKEPHSMFTRPLTIRVAAPKTGQAQGES